MNHRHPRVAALVVTTVLCAALGGLESVYADGRQDRQAGDQLQRVLGAHTPGLQVRAECRDGEPPGTLTCRWWGQLRAAGWTYACNGWGSRANGQSWRTTPCQLSAPRLAPLQEREHGLTLGVNDDWAANYYASEKINRAARADLTVLRFPLGWQSVQPISRHLWSWKYMDRIMQAAAEAGERVIFKPMGSPCWAHPSTECTTAKDPVPPDPEYLDEWQRYVQRVIQRYPGLIVGVEVWNEPNQHPYWDAPLDAARYTRLLRATYPAVKAVAPRLPVIFGGLSPTTDNDADHMSYIRFLNRSFAAGAGGHFDALAFHPYASPKSSPDFRTQIRSMLARVSEIAARNGEPGIPIWVTEFGYPVSTKLDPDEQAARLVATLHTLARIPRIPLVVVHRMFDQPGEGAEAGYGLMEVDGSTPKPAYCALLTRAGTSCNPS